MEAPPRTVGLSLVLVICPLPASGFEDGKGISSTQLS